MQNIFIDEEFRTLLPALDTQTYALLEESILENGCREPITLWNDILIDGYNRHRICTEHDLPFRTVSMEFASREEVLIWIINNQIMRRNLTPMQLSHFRGLHYRADKEIVKNARGKNQFGNPQLEVIPQNEAKPNGIRTALRLAEKYKVSKATIERDAKLSKGLDAIGEISPEAKRILLSGNVSINKSKLNALASMTRDELEALIAEIEDGTYKRRAPAAPGVTGEKNTVSPAELDFATEPAIASPIETPQFDSVISGMTKDFNYMLQKLSRDNIAVSRSVLRSYIDKLEDLHSSMAA